MCATGVGNRKSAESRRAALQDPPLQPRLPKDSFTVWAVAKPKIDEDAVARAIRVALSDLGDQDSDQRAA